MEIREETKVIINKVYVAVDGEKFGTERECRVYEQKLALKEKIEEAEKLRIEDLDEQLPLVCSEMSENNTFRWYKINNREDFDTLCEACKKYWNYPINYPEIVCVETVGYYAYKDDCYIYYLSELINGAKEFYEMFGYKITFEKVGD